MRGPADPPHVAAIKQLEKLHTQKLWQSGKSKQYYTGLTDILREYLAGRYNFQAMEMTSAEIIARIRELSVEERASKRLGSLLEVADFVKFAKYEPDAVQNEMPIRMPTISSRRQATAAGTATAAGRKRYPAGERSRTDGDFRRIETFGCSRSAGYSGYPGRRSRRRNLGRSRGRKGGRS